MIKVDAGAPIDGEDRADENPTVPAGYTYFGQFVDHDLTLDPTPFNTSERDRTALGRFSLAAALDLDNVYGRGPDDQPYMYNKDGLTLVVGRPGIGNGGRQGRYKVGPVPRQRRGSFGRTDHRRQAKRRKQDRFADTRRDDRVSQQGR